MASSTTDAICQIVTGCEGAKVVVGAGAKAAVSSGFQETAQAMFSSYDDLFKQFLTSWVSSGFLVSLDNKATQWFQQTNLSITIFLLVIGLIVSGARVMYAHRGEPFKEAMQALGRAVAVITFGTAAIQILLWGGDAYAQWILKVSGTSASAGVADASIVASNPALALVVGLLGLLAVALQWMIMVVRQALMVLMNGYWQLTAASSLLRTGKQAFEKVTAWILAFILYKPVAASIYAFAWRLKNGQDGVGGVITGLMLIILAVIALPAIMRLLVPASAAIGGAVGGAMAMGIAASAVQAGVAVGAAVASGGSSAGASGAGAAASKSSSAGVADGGEIAAVGGGGGGGNDAASSVAGGGDSDAGSSGSDSGAGAGGMVEGSTAAGADGSDGASGSAGSSAAAEGASDSTSGQSTTSKAGWAAAGSAAEGAGDGSSTAEGMIGE
jgi:type IV secretion system protein TrbL